MPEYTEVTYVVASRTDVLARDVSQLMQQGWKLHGSIIVDNVLGGTREYIQALIR